MKKKKPTPMEFAKNLYMADHCNGAVSSMRDHDIIDCRVRAFVDGVNWQKRKPKKRRASNGPPEGQS